MIVPLGAVAVILAQALSADALATALDPNPSLSSYVAAAALDARARPIPIHKKLSGTAYYQNHQRKIVFDNVSGILAKFKELSAAVPTYAQVQETYDISAPVDDGKLSTFTLVPKKTGTRVNKLILTIDDATKLLSRATWGYTNGSSLQFDSYYTSDGIFNLESKIDIHAKFPGYSVVGTMNLTDYRTNVPIPDAIFGP